MVDQIKIALGKAHGTLRNNLVVLWFPALFNTAAAVFIMLAVVLVLLPVVPELLTSPDIVSLSPELLSAASGRLLLLLGLCIPVLAVANAGAIFMQARAAKGEQVDTAHFFLGVRTIGVRILVGSLVVWGCYALIFVLSMLVFAQGITKILLEYGVDSIPSPEVMSELLLRSRPLSIVGALLLSLISLIFSMWARVVAIRELGLRQAFACSVKFVQRNFFVVTAVLLLTWLLTTSTQPLVERLPLGGLMVVVFFYIVRVYMSIILMHFYIDKTGK
ncbi:MAG: hypothetical protein FD169_1902 [Bacillota bacterium]|nr:MAG: hypothetical protein FD169_1902 [Bacillota bacterium]MBS3950986.1 hypothetical protein [Peptococcaceae bacterium]